MLTLSYFDYTYHHPDNTNNRWNQLTLIGDIYHTHFVCRSDKDALLEEDSLFFGGALDIVLKKKKKINLPMTATTETRGKKIPGGILGGG